MISRSEHAFVGKVISKGSDEPAYHSAGSHQSLHSSHIYTIVLHSAVAQLVEHFNWGSKICQFESHCWRRQCVVSLSKTLHPQLSTGSTQEDRS